MDLLKSYLLLHFTKVSGVSVSTDMLSKLPSTRLLGKGCWLWYSAAESSLTPGHSPPHSHPAAPGHCRQQTNTRAAGQWVMYCSMAAVLHDSLHCPVLVHDWPPLCNTHIIYIYVYGMFIYYVYVYFVYIFHIYTAACTLLLLQCGWPSDAGVATERDCGHHLLLSLNDHVVDMIRECTAATVLPQLLDGLVGCCHQASPFPILSCNAAAAFHKSQQRRQSLFAVHDKETAVPVLLQVYRGDDPALQHSHHQPACRFQIPNHASLVL